MCHVTRQGYLQITRVLFSTSTREPHCGNRQVVERQLLPVPHEQLAPFYKNFVFLITNCHLRELVLQKEGFLQWMKTCTVRHHPLNTSALHTHTGYVLLAWTLHGRRCTGVWPHHTQNPAHWWWNGSEHGPSLLTCTWAEERDTTGMGWQLGS